MKQELDNKIAAISALTIEVKNYEHSLAEEKRKQDALSARISVMANNVGSWLVILDLLQEKQMLENLQGKDADLRHKDEVIEYLQIISLFM